MFSLWYYYSMPVSKLEYTKSSIQQVLWSSQSSIQKLESIKLTILDLLIIREEYFNNLQKGVTPQNLKDRYRDQSEWYKRQQEVYENHAQWGSNPAWIQLNCYSGLKPNSDTNIKLYRSIPINEYAFIAHLWKLKWLFEVLSSRTWDYISFKFPRWFVGFLKHRDSLVIHFQKKENIDTINDILQAWMKDNNITQEKRENNRSELAVDHSSMSFSELIAINYAYQILQKPHQLDELIHSALQESQKPNF